MRFHFIAALLLALVGVSSSAEAQRSAVSHKTAVVRQTSENEGCSANCQIKEAFITIPHAVGDMLKGGIGARQVHGTPIDGVPVFPRKTSWVGPDENDLAREFDQFIVANVPAYANAMTTWQAQYGLGTATHDIIQKLTHRGKQKRVIVNLITFDNGNFYYNGARVMPENATELAQILYVRAIPGTVTPGLEPTWNWAGGGSVYHEMRGPTFAPGAGLIPTAVGTGYDEAFDYSGVPYDPDGRLKCLVDKSKAGCGQPQPDVKGMIGTTDATYAVLDYYRRIKPVGTPIAGGYRAQMPMATVTDRMVTFACPTENNGTYSQVFRYTMNLEQRIDRYLVFPDGRHYFVQSFRDVVPSPQAAVPGSSAINRFGEYPNLATRFLHHISGAFTDNGSYAPNPVSLGAVTLNQPASCGCPPQAPYQEVRACSALNASWMGNFTRSYSYSTTTCSWSFSDDTTGCTGGCPPQAPYQEIRACSELNSSWLGNFTRSFTYSTSTCSWSSSDDTSSCTTGGGPDVCDNIPGVQTSPPPGTIQSGPSCICTGGRNWNNGTMSCQCPSGTTWNGAMCVPVEDQCEYIDDALDPPIQTTVPAGMTQVIEGFTKRCYGAGYCTYSNGWQTFSLKNGGILTEAEPRCSSPTTATRGNLPPNGVSSQKAWNYVCAGGSIQPLFQSWSCITVNPCPGTCGMWIAD